MAVDTANKRYSLIGISSPVPRILPIPDGTIGVSDRGMLLYLYHETLVESLTSQGSVTGTASVGGTLVGSGFLTALSAGSATVVGSLYGLVEIAGQVAGSSIATGTLSAQGSLAGSSAGQATAAGDLAASGYLSSLVAGSSSLIGILSAVGYLNGSVSGTVVVTGTLNETLVTISGSATGSAAVSATLNANGYLSGAISGIAVVAGSITSNDAESSVPMLSAGIWRKNQPNTILFVMVDSDGAEVTGLGSSFTLQISKTGNSFVASSGTKSEVGLGWYKYVSTASEANTSGPVAIVATGSGAIQQNLEYVVEDRIVTAIEFTYTLTSTVGGTPIPGADISFSVNSNPANSIWSGVTDAFGVARDLNGNLPRLTPGSYYVFAYKPQFIFENPDLETVS